MPIEFECNNDEHGIDKNVNLVKVQFRGPELYKKKGALFQDKFYLPGIFMPSRTSWQYDCK